MAAAVSEAGGLGTLGAGYMKPAEIREAVREIRRLTDKPFAVNLFIPEPYEEEDGTMEQARRLLQPYCRELGLAGEGPAAAKPYAEPFEEQAQVLLEEKVPVFSFTFGVPSADWIDAFKKEGFS
ncbi:nitronate monooxygenase [Paenibacillus sp. CC-CFT747]|nr:nitronate monooxygenase [Paenibacillus sp. CC-CFT747]